MYELFIVATVLTVILPPMLEAAQSTRGRMEGLRLSTFIAYIFAMYPVFEHGQRDETMMLLAVIAMALLAAAFLAGAFALFYRMTTGESLDGTPASPEPHVSQ